MAGSARVQDQVWPAVQGLDAWFDTQRQPGGYGGPVVHWWRDCLDYTAPGLDWRYEGIICGYLNLWSATGEDRWLAKATRAGDDLVAGQLPSANYRNSSFELNPATAGTPHEAANDLALLRLAGCLRRTGQGDWQRYARTAERNLHEFFIQRLWDARARHFRDSPSVPSFVPNKAATLAEALLALSRCTGNDEWAGLYALPTLHSVLAHQVRGGALDGAICQNSFGPRRVDKFFPFYVARCIPGLLDGFAWSQDERLADGARHAAEFVKRCRYDDGSFPQVLYLRGLANRYPQWVAATGDILRAMALASTVGVEFDPQPTQRWLLAGLRADGGIHTALGFGRATPGGSEHDPRDQLSVCGWADKAFRYLTEQLPASSQQPAVKAQSIRP